MQPSSQQCVPYRFTSGTFAVGNHTISWPNQYQGLITSVYMQSVNPGAGAGMQVEDTSGDSYGYWVMGSGGDFPTGHGRVDMFQVLDAGSGLVVAVADQSVQVAISGWLLDPPGSTIIP